MQKITPFLWFDDKAEEAANFYVSLFKNSKVGDIARYDEAGAKASGRPSGSVMVVEFQLEGQEFIALNGGPEFTFDEAISFQVNCESQQEVDRFWAALSDGGHEGPCGWLKDKFGVSWQIVPRLLMDEMLNDPDAEKVQRVMRAVLSMGKLDCAELRRAADAA